MEMRNWRPMLSTVSVMVKVKALRRLRSVLVQFDEYLRALLLSFVIRPAALVLPAGASGLVCRAIAFLLMQVSLPARDRVVQYLSAFVVDRAEARRMAQEQIEQALSEYAAHVRVSRRPGSYRRSTCEHVNHEALDKVLAAGGSFVLAMALFARDELVCWAFDPMTLPLALIHVTGPIPKRRWLKSQSVLNSLRFRALTLCRRTLHDASLELAFVGEPAATVDSLVRRLESSRCAVVINIDAPWDAKKHKGAIERPFAASMRSSFGVGAARIARIAGSPIVLCLQEHRDGGGYRLVWYDPVWVPREGGFAAEVAATNRMLDEVERRIGANPERYLMNIGVGRRWNVAASKWQCESSPENTGTAQ